MCTAWQPRIEATASAFEQDSGLPLLQVRAATTKEMTCKADKTGLHHLFSAAPSPGARSRHQTVCLFETVQDMLRTPLYQQHASHTLASRVHGPQPHMRSSSATGPYTANLRSGPGGRPPACRRRHTSVVLYNHVVMHHFVSFC